MVNINNSVLPVLCGSNLYTMQVLSKNLWCRYFPYVALDVMFEVTNIAFDLHVGNYILNLINLILAVELSSN